MSLGADTTFGGGRRPGFTTSLVAHIDIILALAARDFRGRFGQNSWSYLWAYLAPLAWIAATYLGFYIFSRTVPVYTDTITFIISGLIPYASFRYTVTALGRVNNGIRGLLIFPQVRHEHGIAAVALLEYLNIFVVFAVVASANYLLFGNGELDNVPQFVAGVSLAWGLGASYGYLFSALGRYRPSLQRLGAALLRPTFFISGVFFTANELPDNLLQYFSWNPLLHAIEVARDGMLFHYQSRVASPLYVVAWIAVLTLAGAVVSASREA
jgi:capsular polysaccharide transport system permease protein